MAVDEHPNWIHNARMEIAKAISNRQAKAERCGRQYNRNRYFGQSEGLKEAARILKKHATAEHSPEPKPNITGK